MILYGLCQVILIISNIIIIRTIVTKSYNLPLYTEIEDRVGQREIDSSDLLHLL